MSCSPFLFLILATSTTGTPASTPITSTPATKATTTTTSISHFEV